jgi:NAD(P)-dependent dehydrogenase (short-subunit alcohol dehydrogenase family)
MKNLTGKAALVTGSTDGVGRLVARKLGQAGARVLVHGREHGSTSSIRRQGRCLCGAIRFVAEGNPRWVAHCHARAAGEPQVLRSRPMPASPLRTLFGAAKRRPNSIRRPASSAAFAAAAARR